MRLAAGLAVALLAGAAEAAPRVLSLDGCADQFVMALAPRGSIVGVSHRADDPDSWLRERAAGLPVRRASFESVWAARPEVVVRYWGGEPRLLRSLERRGVRVVTIEEATDFSGVQANVERVAAALDQAPEGRRVAARMDADLAAARGAWGEREALYLTPGAFTAGSGTLIEAMLRAAGVRNAETGAGFRPAPLERVVLNPPAAVVRGFWDTARFARWSLGGHGALRRVLRRGQVADVPGAMLGCPGPMAAEGARMLAEAAPR
jgi:iron complex transport system substrate-binding protein